MFKGIECKLQHNEFHPIWIEAGITYLRINSKLRQIKNVILYQAVELCLYVKMNDYLRMAVKIKRYEAAANFNRYLKPVIE